MPPKTYLANEHDIDHSQIDPDALYVIEKLKKSGHTAYIVGGGVRDLLIKRTPKDFDISTSASPEEIKAIFKRSCLLIGRRFRLAHIRFGHKVLELATFRSGDNESDLIVRDNTWGTEEEDVTRRDFTINGLFYDPTNRTVIDYVGGWEDVHKRVLKTIGDPRVRFKQDPVRMIRLLKFRARYGLEIDLNTKKALLECRRELIKSSPARILEEIFRMLESGYSARFFHLMTKAGLLELIFPSLTAFLNSENGNKVYRLLEIADQIHLQNKNKPLDRSILAACLIFPILEQEINIQFTDKEAIPHQGDIMVVSSALTKTIVTSPFSHFPRRISTLMNSIITTQYRLMPHSGKRHYRNKLLRSKDFPLALKFLQIRAAANKELADDYNTWKNAYRQAHTHGSRKVHHPAPVKEEKPE